MNGDRAVIKDGKKDLVEAPVKMENGKDKYPTTTVSHDNNDGKYHLREIHIGGTSVSIVFASLASSN